MKHDSKYIDVLIAKFLAGEISPEEDVILKEWIENSPENKKYFGDVRYVHDKTVASHPYQKVNVDKAWERLTMKMDDAQERSGSKIIQMHWRPLVAVAAIVLVFLGIGYWYLNNFTPVHPSVELATVDSIKTLQIQDKVEVVLNQNSSLQYAENKKDEIEVQLSGEAFFTVKPEGNKKLVVHTDDLQIRDIGTEFNVKAYPDDSLIWVYVESGKVSITSPSDSVLIQLAGETASYNRIFKTISKTAPVSLNSLAYKNKRFVFRKTKLSEAVEILNSVYPEKIQLSSASLGDCMITVTFDNEGVENIVSIISETLGLQMDHTDKGFILIGNGCEN